jgi:hypothetical protein
LNSYEFYQKFLAIQCHFSGNYDYFKYNGKIKTNPDTFRVTKGKYHYDKWASKLSNHYKAECFIVSNFFYKDIRFISDVSNDPYIRLMAYNESLLYRFEQDLEKYYDDVDPIKESFSGVKDSWFYLIISDYATKGIIFEEYDKKYGDNIIYSDFKDNILKLYPFIPRCFQFNTEKIKRIRTAIKKTLNSSL